MYGRKLSWVEEVKQEIVHSQKSRLGRQICDDGSLNGVLREVATGKRLKELQGNEKGHSLI